MCFLICFWVLGWNGSDVLTYLGIGTSSRVVLELGYIFWARDGTPCSRPASGT